MCTLQYVAPEYIPRIWPHVEKFISSGLEKSANELNADHIKVYLTQGSQDLLIMLDETDSIIGAIVIQLSTYPNERIAFITSLGGARLKEVWAQLLDWCKGKGATTLRGCVAESSVRFWRSRLNCEMRYIVMEKKLWAE